MWIKDKIEGADLSNMKKISTRLAALVCLFAMLLSISSCIRNEPSGTGRHQGGSSKPGWSEPGDPTDPSGADPTPTIVPYTGDYIPTSDELTYPDHVASYDEIHPHHEPGTLKGTEAVNELDQVEYDLLHHIMTSYADVEIFFKDPEKLGFHADNVSWGESGTLEDIPAEQAYYQSLLDRLLTIDYRELKGDDRLCYDKLLFDLEETVYSHLQHHRGGPHGYLPLHDPRHRRYLLARLHG